MSRKDKDKDKSLIDKEPTLGKPVPEEGEELIPLPEEVLGEVPEDIPEPTHEAARSTIRLNGRKDKGSRDESDPGDGSRIIVSGGKRRNRVMDIRAARKRQKEKRRLRTVMILLVVMLLAEMAYMFRAAWVPKLEALMDKNKEIVVNDGKNQKGNFPITYSEGSVSDISFIGNCLVTVDKNQVRLYNENGTEAGSFPHSFADPVLRTADKRMMLYDKGGTFIKVMNRTSEIFTKTLGSRIILADIADNNNLVVVTSNEKYQGIMTVYDPNGREIFKWSSSTRILSVSFAEEGESMIVTTFSQSGGQLCSVVRHFSLDSENELMKSKPLPILAVRAGLSSSGDYWVAGDTAFYRLDDRGDVLMSWEYPGTLKAVDMDESCAVLCFEGTSRLSSELIIFRSDSAAETPDSHISAQDGAPVSMVVSGGKVILLKTMQVDCYDIFGSLLATAELESQHTAMTFFGDSIYFLDFKEINKISFTT